MSRRTLTRLIATAAALFAGASFAPAPPAGATTAAASSGVVQAASLGTVGIRARANGRYAVAENGGTQSMLTNRQTIGAWEKFTVIGNADGTVSLAAGVNGRYVAAENAGRAPLIANRPAVGAWEKFTMLDNGDGSVSFKAQVNGMFVVAENAGNGVLVANRTAVGPWEKFEIVPADEPNGSMTNAEFIAAAAIGAQDSQREFGVPASVTIAQAILESGWGRSALSHFDKNYFGMKCFNQGKFANGCRTHNTDECTPLGQCFATSASFRTYATVTNSFRDHGYLLATAPRYAPAFQYVKQPDLFVAEMHKAGYATDPLYTQKLTALMAKYNLYRFDLK
ncbi:hypothetical protein Val02_01360 [Virgisporangium aliadipatigenens]|uniref:Mannosyl-glycoprotein endo-beta-N-acetylglucosamidase-like domain-containing protein n=1 Tax=Virgisporangium aliadipatigenens TaxID=741659 RepID=A0A8J3YFR4_9ACTN|nr:sporangiospore maturation cell wall hydrolase GsmA [Virgisporangium aliadipatigenens]GIJ43250.1 hypothetical protein Val02_01360 [Virgisporangium aliadipatigenens]